MRKNIFAKVLALMMLLVMLPVMALAADFAVVHGGRLNLREYASSTSRSLGKYNSGTWVSVQGQSVSGWVPVRMIEILGIRCEKKLFALSIASSHFVEVAAMTFWASSE